MNRILKVAMFCTLACLATAASLQAANVSWLGGTSTAWTNAANWDSNPALPGSGDGVYINVLPDIAVPPTYYAPTVSTDIGTINTLEVGRTVSSEAEGTHTGPGYLKITAGGAITTNSEITVGIWGTTPTVFSTLEMTGGTLTKGAAGNLHFGWENGAGEFLMSGGTYNQTGAGAYFGGGAGATGKLTMSGSAQFLANQTEVNIGLNGGVGSMSLQGNAIFTNTLGVTLLGRDGGSGSMTIDTGATFSTAELMLGQNVGSVGTLTMTGGTLNLKTSTNAEPVWYGWEGTLDIGRWGGSGTMDVSGGTVNVNGRTNIGNGDNRAGVASTGSLTLSGTAKMITAQGRMRNYGYYWTDGGDVYVGSAEYDQGNTGASQVGGTGTLTVKDDAVLNMTEGTFVVGVHGGTGTVSITDNATVTSRWDTWIGKTLGNGTVTVNGANASLNVGGWLNVGGEGGGSSTVGNLTLENGAVNAASTTFIGRQGTTGTVTVNGGTFTTGETILTETWPSGGVTHYANATLNINAGVYTTSNIRTWNGSGGDSASVQTVNLNGGILRATQDNGGFINPNGNTQFHVYLANNPTIDSNGHQITVLAALEGTGGLTKAGLGNLILTNSLTNYAGPTDVVAGKLTIACGNTSTDNFWGFPGAVAPNEITVRTGAAVGNDYLGYNDINANLHLEAKSTISVGVTGAPFVSRFSIQDVSNVGSTSLPVVIDLNLQDPSQDLSTLAGQPVLKYVTRGANGAVPTYVTPVDSIGQRDWTYTDSGAGEVYVNLTSSTRGWQVATPGNWNTAANWAEGVVPNGTDAKAWLADAYGAVPGVVTLNTNATLSSLLLKGGYTINPAASNSITLNSTLAANSLIQSLGGANVVNANIAMAAGDPVIIVTTDSSLALNGVLSDLSGPSGISFNGKGTLSGDQWNGGGGPLTLAQGKLTLTGANTFTGPVIMTGFGKLEIPTIGASTAAGPLGMSSAAPGNLVINGELALTATSTTPVTYETDRGFTLAGTSYAYTSPQIFTGPGGYDVISVNENVTLKITGQTAVAPDMTAVFGKTGKGTLVLANAGTANALSPYDFQIHEGAVVIDTGTYTKGRSNTWFQYGGGDVFVGLDAGNTAKLTLQNGAVFNNGGDTRVGDAGSTGYLDINGATLNTGAWTYIGCDTAGTKGYATIRNGGVLYTSGITFIGRGSGSEGHMTLSTGASVTTNDNELYVGHDKGVGYLTMEDNSHFQVNGWAQVGRGAGTGTLTMSGSSRMDVTQEFRLGVAGATGTLNMSGTSMLVARNLDRIGQNTDWEGQAGVLSKAYVNMTGSSKMISTYDPIRFGANGGYAEVSLNGNNASDPVLVGNLAGVIGDTWDIYVGCDSGTGIVTMDGYSLINTGYDLRVGATGGNGTLNVGSATGAAVISLGGHLRVGYDGGTGTMNIGPGANIGVNGWLQVGNSDGGAAGVGIVNMTGGLITKNPVADSYMIIGRTGTGTWTQSGGLADIRTGVTMGNGGSTGTLNLNGGVFSTGFIQAGYEPDATAIMRINFDGGTLKVNTNSIYAAAGGSNFVTPYSSTDALINIKAGGATVDTSGNDVAIAVNIAEDSLSTGGSFTKIGGGTLTLSGSVGYKGDTIVNQGGLTINAGLNTPTATVYVADGTTLTTPSLIADSLVIGGGPHAAASAAAVPEPSTFVLLGLAGAIALLAIRRRK